MVDSKMVLETMNIKQVLNGLKKLILNSTEFIFISFI